MAPVPQGDRTVRANSAEANAGFVDNVVITSKYTWYNFLPVFLLEQFARFANFYFLVVSILQTIPAITITGGIPTNFLPLSIVLLFDGVVTAREDYKRHVDDHKANSSMTSTLREGSFTPLPWSAIRVGDILKVARNAPVPADCVFLAAFSPDSNTPDTCYVQTAQLDGETNLKLRQAVPASVDLLTSDEACAAFRGCIVCEAPNAAFDKFVGMLYMDAGTPSAGDGGEGLEMGSLDGGRPVPLEAEQILLRGSILRNTDYAYAMVVYSGRETKVRVRQTARVTKRAQIESMLNRLILVLIALLGILCLIGAVGATVWNNARVAPDASPYARSWYLDLDVYTARRFVEQACTYFLLNASFIPVSLYVTVRLARTFQMLIMEKDVAMFHSEPDLVRTSGGLEGEYPFKVRSMDLNDELGQITHIFSDKTGTLTLNYMELRKIMVSGVAYGLGTTQIGMDRLKREGADAKVLAAAAAAEEEAEAGGEHKLPHVNFRDGSDSHPGRTMAADSSTPNDGGQGTAIHNFLLNLALNHTVLPEVVRDSSGAIVGSRLSAASPDEEAFVLTGSRFGYSFTARTHETVTLHCVHGAQALPFASAPPSVLTPPVLARNAARPAVAGAAELPAHAGGCTLLFRTLSQLSYTQERKRMSVVYEHPVLLHGGHPTLPGSGPTPMGCTGTGAIVLYCKGADSAILARLRPPVDEAEAERLRSTRRQLAEWGNDGLRTLVFAYRVVPRAEYEAWAVRYAAACTDLEEVRKRKNKESNAIEDLQEELERGMVLQGATANEDKLQPEVPETIALLAKAGVRLWMVTGDKQETAVNIGFATRLLDDTMRQVVVTAESAGGVTAGMKRLRIAAKRIRAERKEDAERDKGKTRDVTSAAAWLSTQLTAVEERLGLELAQDRPAEIDIDAAAAANDEEVRAAAAIEASGGRLLARVASIRRPRRDTVGAALASPRTAVPSLDLSRALGGMQPRDLAEAFIVSPARGKGGDEALSPRAVPTSLTELSARERAVSFASEEGEEEGEGGLLEAGGPEVVDRPPKALSSSSATIQLASSLLAMPLSLRAQRRPFALVIDEGCLDAALQHPRAKAYLLYVAVNCSAVIACRARPDQKAQVVRLIRAGVPNSRTLAIGDGANDVDMISSAHVGVGIAGVEGVQAANSSDYAIGRFRFLQRLLLVHGRWNYNRMSRAVLYMFWKNIVFVLTQFLSQTATGFSGQKWYIEYGAQLYNLLFTGLPVLLLAVYDTDVPASVVLRYPKLYDHGRLARGLNTRVFAAWLLDAIATAIVVYFFTTAGSALPSSGITPDPAAGSTPYVFSLGTTAFTSILAVVSLRIGAEMFAHHWFVQVAIGGSVLLWPICCFIFDAMRQDGMQGGMKYVWTSPTFYLTVALTVGALGVKMAGWKAWRRAYGPDFRHLVQEVTWTGGSTAVIDEYAEAADMARRTGRSLQEILDADRLATVAASALAPALAAQSLASGGAYVPFHQRAMMAAGGRVPLTEEAPPPRQPSVMRWGGVPATPVPAGPAADVAVPVSDGRPGLSLRTTGPRAAASLISPRTLGKTVASTRQRILESALLPRHLTADELAFPHVDPSSDFDRESEADQRGPLGRGGRLAHGESFYLSAPAPGDSEGQEEGDIAVFAQHKRAMTEGGTPLPSRAFEGSLGAALESAVARLARSPSRRHPVATRAHDAEVALTVSRAESRRMRAQGGGGVASPRSPMKSFEAEDSQSGRREGAPSGRREGGGMPSRSTRVAAALAPGGRPPALALPPGGGSGWPQQDVTEAAFSGRGTEAARDELHSSPLLTTPKKDEEGGGPR